MSAAQIPTAAGAAVTIAHVSKRFGTLKALNGVSLEIGPGMVQGLIGPSGAGKSTLLRCIDGGEAIDEGTIHVDGAPIGTARQGPVVGMVWQSPALFDHMTALQHVLEGPLALSRLPRREIVAEAMAALERVGLAERRDSYPGELSGGPRQRLAIARALAARPRLMLLDEPTAGLEPDAAGEVLDAIREIAASGLTMIAVTHELDFMRGVADELAFMAGGEIIEQGPPQRVLAAARQERTRAFLATLGA